MKKFLIVFGITASVFLAAAGGYAFYLYSSAKQAVTRMQEPVETNEPKPVFATENLPPISILLLGVDERANDKGRSDTMIVVTVNPKRESMLLFNIPRDTRTEIIGKGTVDKINHAYSFGGPQMAMDTVEHFLDMKLDYFVKINMQSFQEIVDAVGGVTVNNPSAFSFEGYEFPAGSQQLNGSEALAYSRMRYDDKKGDLGRNDRQRQVIQSIISKGANVSTITKFDNILEILSKNVKTNMTFDEMQDIQSNYKNARRTIESTEIKGVGQRLNGVWYYSVSEEERLRVVRLIKEHMS
ncbi:LCP family protein [Fictibacillus iocasae]|uniref:LCP family protein n=1 Tax=Fictibacillus iocasae TaxID=2715437 RepID=A0ABW2NQ32_9BACL